LVMAGQGQAQGEEVMAKYEKHPVFGPAGEYEEPAEFRQEEDPRRAWAWAPVLPPLAPGVCGECGEDIGLIGTIVVWGKVDGRWKAREQGFCTVCAREKWEAEMAEAESIAECEACQKEIKDPNDLCKIGQRTVCRLCLRSEDLWRENRWWMTEPNF
jgi:hypothetical protein